MDCVFDFCSAAGKLWKKVRVLVEWGDRRRAGVPARESVRGRGGGAYLGPSPVLRHTHTSAVHSHTRSRRARAGRARAQVTRPAATRQRSAPLQGGRVAGWVTRLFLEIRYWTLDSARPGDVAGISRRGLPAGFPVSGAALGQGQTGRGAPPFPFWSRKSRPPPSSPPSTPCSWRAHVARGSPRAVPAQPCGATSPPSPRKKSKTPFAQCCLIFAPIFYFCFLFWLALHLGALCVPGALARAA